ncbi:hypothetical protein [Streptomyces sp. NPDC059753]|uniref:hypothetical protein n=1 Tax=Streptomyces sp. NPDC059753 TaxID=3346933 RepID=UPI0036683575
MPKRDHAKWLRIYDSPTVAGIEPDAPYQVEASYDGGRTWVDPHATTGHHLQLTMTEALYAERTVENTEGVVTVQNVALLVRYTPSC